MLIKNIKSLVQVGNSISKPLSGKSMSELPSVENAFLLIENGIVHSYGEMKDCPERAEETIDASGRIVLPAWCDSHTHLVFAGSRESEFVDRIKGLSYEEIAAKGGGILNSAKKLSDQSEAELLENAIQRAEEIRSMGTGAVEIKSGYGLSTEAELKILRVIRELKNHTYLRIKSNFLGAHAFPAEFKQNHQGYLDKIINEMLPQIADEGLADYIDVFCESNYFSVEETDLILEAGAKYGLKPKIHVNQFTSIGGIECAVKHGAVSVDHLEVMKESDFEALKGSQTIATLLPSCSFFINIDYAPGRKLIDQNIPVALASDYNPGSTPSGNIPFVVSLACIKMRLLPSEAINAATINGAFAMEVDDTHGSIEIGKKANIAITKPISSINMIPYAFGSDLVERTVLN